MNPSPENIKKARDTAGLTVQEAADHLGVSRPTIYNIEDGTTRNPGARLMVRMAALYGVPVSDLFETVEVEA